MIQIKLNLALKGRMLLGDIGPPKNNVDGDSESR